MFPDSSLIEVRDAVAFLERSFSLSVRVALFRVDGRLGFVAVATAGSDAAALQALRVALAGPEVGLVGADDEDIVKSTIITLKTLKVTNLSVKTQF